MDDTDSDKASAFRLHSGGKQQGIPGIVREYAGIERAAEDLREAERACKAATEIKATMGEKLLFALQREGVRKYKYTDSEGRRFTVKAESKTTVSVKRGWEESDGES